MANSIYGHPYNISPFADWIRSVYKGVVTVGWLVAKEDGDIVFGGYCVSHKHGEDTIIEFPHGPVALNEEYLVNGLKILPRMFSKYKEILIGPYFEFNSSLNEKLYSLGYSKTKRLWHEFTVRINLQDTIEFIYSNMSNSPKNAIKSAISNNYSVKKTKNEDEIKKFIYQHNILAANNGFEKLSLLYVNRALKNKNIFLEANLYQLYDGDGFYLASALVINSTTHAFYQRGSSIKTKNVKAQFLQYEIIKDLKKKNIKYYDLGGINPMNEKCGVSQFKRKISQDGVIHMLPQYALRINRGD